MPKLSGQTGEGEERKRRMEIKQMDEGRSGKEDYGTSNHHRTHKNQSTHIAWEGLEPMWSRGWFKALSPSPCLAPRSKLLLGERWFKLSVGIQQERATENMLGKIVKCDCGEDFHPRGPSWIEIQAEWSCKSANICLNLHLIFDLHWSAVLCKRG